MQIRNLVVTFDPQSGHEQRGRRPALVVSNDLFNKHTGMAIVCPVTNTDRGYPFHVPIHADLGVTGFAVAEQVKSIDFRARKAKFVAHAPEETVQVVQRTGGVQFGSSATDPPSPHGSGRLHLRPSGRPLAPVPPVAPQ